MVMGVYITDFNACCNLGSDINDIYRQAIQGKNKFKSVAIYNEEIYESEVVELTNETYKTYGGTDSARARRSQHRSYSA